MPLPSTLLPLLAAALMPSGQDAELPPIAPMPPVAPADRTELGAWFGSMDTNRDGVLAAFEFERFFAGAATPHDAGAEADETAGALRMYFDALDSDGSGTVTRQEFDAFHSDPGKGAEDIADKLSPR